MPQDSTAMVYRSHKIFLMIIPFSLPSHTKHLGFWCIWWGVPGHSNRCAGSWDRPDSCCCQDIAQGGRTWGAEKVYLWSCTHGVDDVIHMYTVDFACVCEWVCMPQLTNMDITLLVEGNTAMWSKYYYVIILGLLERCREELITLLWLRGCRGIPTITTAMVLHCL